MATSSSSSSSVGKLAEIHIPLVDAQDTTMSTVHAMPFNTDFNGAVPIKGFFNSTMSISNDGGDMTSYVRGRELKGKTFPVPSGMVGTVVRKDTETGYVSSDVFTEIHVWEHDLAPDGSVARLQELTEFVEISNCIHEDRDDTASE